MAIIWQKNVRGVHYEVRTAGASTRLYTDGVFHSQYNPKQPLTGHVWDLLMLPAFFYPRHSIRRVLVLGVGGGAAIHMLRHFVKPQQIIGVELNPVHIQVARRFFHLRDKSIELVEADAVSWLKAYRGEKFDMIIDDLFAEKAGEPVAVVDAGPGWFRHMLKHLTRQGMIVRNFIDKAQLIESAGLSHQPTAQRFANVFQLTSHYNENHVGVFLRQPSSARTLHSALQQTPGLNPKRKTCRLRFSLKKRS